MAKDTIKAALAYWDSLRGERAMPRRADLDPLAIPRLLPYIMLVDVLSDPLDFRFRLIGTAVDLIISRNYGGMRFSELAHMAPGNKVFAEYAQVIETRRPFRSSVSYVGSDRYVRSIEHCLMPLSADGETANMVFVAVEIERR